MKYVKLGNSDLNVSRICLGCMTFGDANEGMTMPSGVKNEMPWLLNQDQTDDMVKKALDLGINFFDTANIYANGTSEIYLGNSIKKFAKREDVIIATKVYFNEGKLSKEAIFKEVDKSLKRLQTDYIDLLIIHRWDYSTPIEETMQALHQVIIEGKVRYIGASAMYAFQFLKAQEVARNNGWTPFISMQNHYNLIYREEEREMIKLLKEENVSMTPYSPLAGGRLARDWDAATSRAENDKTAKMKYDSDKENDYPIVMRVKELADKYNVTRGQIAMAWLLSKDMVASPIVGVSKIHHLEDAVLAVNVALTKEDINYLEELYKPHKVVGALDN